MKKARHKLSQSGNNVFNDGPSMAARETWSMLSKDYEAGKRMAILTDAQDQQLILILFAGKPIRFCRSNQIKMQPKMTIRRTATHKLLYLFVGLRRIEMIPIVDFS
jgi:hypothetical protein